MKLKATLSILFILIFTQSQAQVDFVLSNTVCAGDTISLTATNGTFNAGSYSWTANPAGAWFASTTANHTDIMFPSFGIYTVTLYGFSGSSVSSASHVIQVYPQPNITISSSHSLMCAGEGGTLTANGASSYAWEPQALVSAIAINKVYISPFVTTIFTVTGADNLGCQNTVYFTQQVVPYPNLQVNATSSVVCPGMTSTLSALGAASYTWTGGSAGTGVVQPSVAAGAGNYTVIGSNGASCKDTVSISLLMGMPLSIGVSADRMRRCIKDTIEEPGVSLNASGATSYSWEPYDPAQMTYSIGQSTYVTPTVTTCYTVTGYGNSCIGNAVLCVQVSECTGIEEADLFESMRLFPNPASESVYLHCPVDGEISLKIVDLSGRPLLDKRFEITGQEKIEVEVRDLPKGLYFTILSWQNRTKILRLIKE